MFVKVLFFDTSAILRLFLDQPGFQTARWLTSAPVKVSNGLTFHVSATVAYEFNQVLDERVNLGKLSPKRANDWKDRFNRHYLNRWFKTANHRPPKVHSRGLTLTQVFGVGGFRLYGDNRDASILHTVDNALGSLAGLSHPILVTCDVRFARRARKLGYRTINPAAQSRSEILSIIRSAR